jgi:hypothetical protein
MTDKKLKDQSTINTGPLWFAAAIVGGLTLLIFGGELLAKVS